MLPLPHIDAALKEMERGFDQLGCVGRSPGDRQRLSG
jgi:hypothetical protein